MRPESTFLKFGRNTEDKYKFLKEVVFADASNSQVFMIAMAWGFRNETKVEDFPQSQNGPRTELTEENFALMKVLQAASDGNPDSLTNDNERYTLAMNFAEAGVKLLYDRFRDLGEDEAQNEVMILLDELIQSGGDT